jgi:RHS repeat-associated protein
MDENRNNNSWNISRFYYTSYVLIVGFLLLCALSTRAQYPDVIYMKHNMIGDATVVARKSVIHQPGFHVKPGLYYHAYIDPNFSGSGFVYITPPTPGGLTVSPSDMNYIITTTPQIELFHPGSNYTCDKVSIDIVYFDGLGREIQDVSVMATPNQKDMINYHTYDNAGRKYQDFVPYPDTAQNGRYDINYVVNQKNFINHVFGASNQDYGFAQEKFDDSPLNRITKKSAPGLVWAFNSNPAQEHVQELNYNTNSSSIAGWRSENNSLVALSYSPGELFVNTVKNENKGSNQTVTNEYKDKLGNLVMTEELIGSSSIQTRYIYDEFGLLRCVVPPKSSDPINDPGSLCFYYNYDERHRLIEKKLPGTGWQYFIYDKRDRLVMSQDAKMREEDPFDWLMNNYDGLNHLVMSGIYAMRDEENRAAMQAIYTNSVHILSEEINGNYNNTEHGYTRNVSQSLYGNYSVLIVYYYDNYNFDPAPKQYDFNSNSGIGTISKIDPITNKITGTKVKQLNGDVSLREWVESAFYYDNEYRVIQSNTENPCLDGKDTISTIYSFTGRVDSTKITHTAFSNTLSYIETFKYDQRGRLLAHGLRGLPNQAPVLLTAMNYDSLGQLSTKYSHSEYSNGGYSPFIQKTDYRYNIRGWLTSINNPDNTVTENDIFAMKLFYNDGMNGITGQAVQFNGNISACQWKSNRLNDKYCYRYSYDNLNRLKAGIHFSNSAGSWVHNNSFDEDSISYDANGNILTLNRFASNATEIDHLNYFYLNNSNQISHITDAMGDVPGLVDYQGDNSSSITYGYDVNGNMMMDLTKGLGSIHYNFLNKPDNLDFGNGEKIEYIYDGTGKKLVKKVENGNTLLQGSQIYTGNFVYDFAGNLKYILTSDGRIVPDGTDYRFEYFMKDHLGNTRATYAQACPGTPQVADYEHYYPFGMEMEALCHTSGADLVNNNLYNGKELQLDYGLQWYDYGARFYDPEIGRWHVVDPLVEKFYGWSPYRYGWDNPIKIYDPNGKLEEDIVIKQNKGEKKTTAESEWLVYKTGTFDKTNPSSLREMSIQEIMNKFGNPITQTQGSSLPDNPTTSNNDKSGNATIKEGKYQYEKGTFSNGLNVLYLSQGKGVGEVPTLYNNYKNNDQNKATGVAAHAGRVDWQNEIISGRSTTLNKGSEGCPTAVGFNAIYNSVENTGNVYILRNSQLNAPNLNVSENEAAKMLYEAGNKNY